MLQHVLVHKNRMPVFTFNIVMTIVVLHCNLQQYTFLLAWRIHIFINLIVKDILSRALRVGPPWAEALTR